MQNYTNKYTKEAEEKVKKLSKNNDIEKAEKLKKYIGTNLIVCGIPSPLQVECLKKGFSFITDDINQNFICFDKLYFETKCFEVKNLSFIYLDKNQKHINPELQFKLLSKWVTEVDNWAHSDYLSKFLTRLLEHSDTSNNMRKQILKWNTSLKLWERRQSLISLYYYARTKKQHVEYDFAIKLIHNLISDKEYFVQKAVGWALRESYNVYPNETFKFIDQNIKLITPVAFTTCIEKMNETQKNNLKQKRKLK